MYYSYVEIEYVATSFSPARTDLAVKLKPRWFLGLVHRLVFKTHKNIKTYLSRQQFRGKYQTPSTGTKYKNIVLHIPFVLR
jgi:hypothetical protein